MTEYLSLDEFLAAYDKDDNEWWRLDNGDQLNFFDVLREDRDGWRDQVLMIRAQQRAALERAEKAEGALARVRAVAEWLSDKEADWRASPARDQYADGARDVCDVAESRLRDALDGPT